MIIKLITLFSLILLVITAAQGADTMPDPSQIKLWAVDPLIKILPDTPIVAGGQLTVNAVRNEYESAQLIVTPAGDVKDLSVSISPVTGPEGVRPRVSANFVGFVPVKKGTFDTPPEHLAFPPPADAPDILLEAKSVSVTAGKNQPIWLTVYVPKATVPGNYTTYIHVTADNKQSIVPLTITVHPVTLPDDRTLMVTNWFSPDAIAKCHGVQMWSEGCWKLLEAWAHSMAEHRQNTVITPLFSLIDFSQDSNGKLQFDFTRFDRWIDLFTRAGVIGCIEGGHLAWRDGGWDAPEFNFGLPAVKLPDGTIKPAAAAKPKSEEARAFHSQFLPALRDHLKERGWLDNYIQHLTDEPIPVNAESYKQLASLVRELAPDFKIIDACMCKEIVGNIDIWVPLSNHFDEDMKFFRERQSKGDQVWFYTCLLPKGKYMNRFIDYPLIDTRLLHWVNFKYNVTGYLHWGLNYWQGDPITDLEPDWGASGHLPPGDSHITYPGKYGPLSSIRFEAMRDGLEDYELLKLLEKDNPKKAKQIADSVITTLTDYTTDPTRFRAARMRLIEALAKE